VRVTRKAIAASQEPEYSSGATSFVPLRVQTVRPKLLRKKEE